MGTVSSLILRKRLGTVAILDLGLAGLGFARVNGLLKPNSEKTIDDMGRPLGAAFFCVKRPLWVNSAPTPSGRGLPLWSESRHGQEVAANPALPIISL